MLSADESVLYLSTSAKAGPNQTKDTIRDCDGVLRALYAQGGAAMFRSPKSATGTTYGIESWRTVQ